MLTIFRLRGDVGVRMRQLNFVWKLTSSTVDEEFAGEVPHSLPSDMA